MIEGILGGLGNESRVSDSHTTVSKCVACDVRDAVPTFNICLIIFYTH